MASFSLASYVLRIRNVEDQEWDYLDSFGASGQDLFTFLHDYLLALGTQMSVDSENKRLIKLRPPLNKDDKARVLTGILETGEWDKPMQALNSESQSWFVALVRSVLVC